MRSSASAPRTLLRASSRVACAISRRRTEIAPGSSPYSRSWRLASLSAISRLASAAFSAARAPSTPAWDALTEWRAIVVGTGALQRDLVRFGIDVEQRLSRLHLVVVSDVDLHTLPATSAATGTTKAWMRACDVYGVSRSPTK